MNPLYWYYYFQSQSSTSVFADGTINIEYLSQLSLDNTLALSFLLQLSNDGGMTLEYTGSLASSQTINVEDLLVFLSNSRLNYDYQLSLAVTGQTYLEFLRQLGVDGVFPMESGLGGTFGVLISADFIIPIEYWGKLRPGFAQWILANRKSIYILNHRHSEFKLK